MSIAATAILGSGLRATQSSYATASWLPVAGRVYLFTVMNYPPSGTAGLPTVTGNGQTWTQVITQLTGDNTNRITTFRCLAAAPSTGTSTIDFGGVNQTFAGWLISDITGMDASGSNGSGAIVQAVGATGGPTASGSVTLAAFGSVGNGTFGVFYPRNTETSGTPGAGFTALNNVLFTSGNDGLGLDEWRVDNATTVDASWSPNTSTWVGIALEIKARTGLLFRGV